MEAYTPFKLNTGTEVLTLKATTSLFARLLVIARSSRECTPVYLEEVMAMNACETMTGVSKQEEADNLIIRHAVEVASNEMDVHIYPRDTDMLFSALRRTSLLDNRSAAIMGTTERRRKVFMQPMYDKLGPEKSGALINWHALTGSNTTGHIHENGKNTYIEKIGHCIICLHCQSRSTLLLLSNLH